MEHKKSKPSRVQIGERFGRLTVVGESHVSTRRDGSTGERVLLCKCDCGKERKVKASNLRTGNTASCGCLHSERTIESNRRREKQ